MAEYKLVGTKTMWDEVEKRSFISNARHVNEAIRSAAIQAISNSESSAKENENNVRNYYHFSLYQCSGDKEKLILTVGAYARKWSDAIQEAYYRVCEWQGIEPKTF